MQRKKLLKIVLMTVSAMLVVAILGISWFMGSSVADGSTRLTTNEKTALNREEQMERWLDDVEAFEKKYTIEQIEIPSTFEEHTIPADYITQNGDKNNDTAIIVHGLGGNRLSIIVIAEMFLEMGYNVIAYDQRSSGENFAEYNTFGYFESYDLLDYVDFADSFMDKDKQLVVWGTSFGGATVGIALGRNSDKIDRAILDCPVSEAIYLIEEASLEPMSVEMGIPLGFMMFTGNAVSKMKLGFSFDDLNVYEWITDTPVPVLIFNSKADTVTPFFMGEDIYNGIRSKNKKLVTVDNSEHANVFFDYPALYKQEVSDFLN